MSRNEIEYLEKAARNPDSVICSLAFAAIAILTKDRKYSDVKYTALVKNASVLNFRFDQRIYLSNYKLSLGLPEPSQAGLEIISTWRKQWYKSETTITSYDIDAATQLARRRAEQDRTLIGEICLTKIGLSMGDTKTLLKVLQSEGSRASAKYKSYWSFVKLIFRLRN